LKLDEQKSKTYWFGSTEWFLPNSAKFAEEATGEKKGNSKA
jgi:hypothetical protein